LECGLITEKKKIRLRRPVEVIQIVPCTQGKQTVTKISKMKFGSFHYL